VEAVAPMRGSTAGQVGKVVLIAVAVETVAVFVTVLANLLAKSAPAAWQILLVPAAGVLIAGIKAGVDALAKRPDEQQPSGGGYGDYGGGGYRPRPPVPAPKRVVPVAAVLAGLLLVCGGGGLAATAGVQYVYGWATGHESGPVVFQGQVSGKAGAVTMTVTQMMITTHFTRVDVTVQNAGSEPVTLPLFNNCQLVAADGTTLEADAFRSRWAENVAPGGRQSGEINLSGKAPPGNATFSFTTVFGPGGGHALVVKGIPVGTL